MNKYTIFRDCSRNNRDEADFGALKSHVSEERDLLGDDIKKIVREHCEKKGLLVTHERNHTSSNENPFDIIIGDGTDFCLIGGEIKGDTDNYTRLAMQLQAYSFVFDGIYLILHKKAVPEWLPEYCGVLRVFENGDVFVEQQMYVRDLFDVGSIYDNDVLLELNGVALKSQEARRKLEILSAVRKNFLFNRFFGISAGLDTRRMTRWWSLSDEQKEVLVGFDIARQYKSIEQDINRLEKKIELFKKVTMIGVTTLKDYQKKEE